MVTATVMVGSGSEGPIVKFQKEYTASTLADVLWLTIHEGACTQIGLATAIREGLEALGHRMSPDGRFSRSHFSDLVNDRDSDLYLWLEVFAIIMEKQGQPWLLEFLAARQGKGLIERRDNEKR